MNNPKDQEFIFDGFEIEPFFDPVKKEDLEQLEQQLGCSLPKEYALFLSQWNGVNFMEGLLYFIRPEEAETEEVGYISFLYGIASERIDNDVQHANSLFKQRQLMPKDILAIGESEAMDRIYLSLRDLDFGYIYYLSEFYGDPEEHAEIIAEDFEFLATNFVEFWKLIKTEKETDDWVEVDL